MDDFLIIKTLRFMQDIVKAKSEKDHAAPMAPFFKRLEERIRDTDSDMLIFPVYLENEKQLDFVRDELSYG